MVEPCDERVESRRVRVITQAGVKTGEDRNKKGYAYEGL